ncbi:RNA polymerase sigma factor [Patescibacteria group bacterium]|nr:MAG: RNA polymerase sigma factor [Patescibacteria group bacterium]
MPNTVQSLREKLLLYRIRVKRDAGAFGRLYDAYVQRIYRFIFFKVPSAEEAQDLTSETFLKLWQHLEQGKPVRNFNALTYGIARNLVADYYRSQGKKPVAELDEETLSVLPDVKALAKLEKTAELSQVLSALKLLKDEYREALIMRYLDGLTPTEIAPVLGKSSGAVRVILHRSLETLRALLTSNE